MWRREQEFESQLGFDKCLCVTSSRTDSRKPAQHTRCAWHHGHPLRANVQWPFALRFRGTLLGQSHTRFPCAGDRAPNFLPASAKRSFGRSVAVLYPFQFQIDLDSIAAACVIVIRA